MLAEIAEIMKSLRSARGQKEAGALLALMALVPLIAVAASFYAYSDLVGAPPRSAVLFGVPLAIAAAIGIGVLLFRAAPLSRGVEVPAALADGPDPVVVSRRNGRVLAMNAAMERRIGPEVSDVVAVLARIVETDAAMIYRLALGAGRMGFAFDQVRERGSGELRNLIAQIGKSDQVIWTLQDLDALSGAVPAALSGGYEGAPFAHVKLDRTMGATPNTRFRELFGPDADAVIERMSRTGRLAAGRYVLPLASGDYRTVRAFLSPVGAPAGRHEDLFIFEIDDGSRRGRGPGGALENVPVAMLQLDPDGRLTWINAAAQRMLGEAASVGVPFDQLVEHRARPLSSLIDEALSGEDRPRPEMVRLAGEGPERFMHLTLAHVELEGQDMLLAVLSDASELRQLEDKFAQSQKMEAVGKLAGGVAHDFNNLLTAINGHCDLLLLGKDASQPDYSDLMQIRQNANRAAALVRQLLAFSRKQTLNPALLSIKDVVSDTLYLLDRLIGDRVTLRLDHAPDAAGWLVRADRQQLEQALMNLVVNARDAMAGEGVVTISTRSRHSDVDEQRQGVLLPAGNYVELAVADSGHGIDQAVIRKVFDPFFTTKAQGEGTGLGLSTVYGIVKQSGGYIFAENRAEGGACFRMLLPALDPSHAEEAETPAKRVPQRERPDLTGRASVLLVEDEAPVRSFATRALKLRGYRVTAAESAEEALAYIRDPDHAIDLIVSDVMMPGMDGPSFAARTRELRPGLRVLFVSGYAEEAFRKNMVDPDYAFLAKPFSLADLTAKVKEVLEGGG